MNTDSQKRLTPGVYKHYKNKYYEVIDIAKHADTGEDFVLYRQLYSPFQLYIRTLEAFIENVEVCGELCKRFELVGDESQ